MNNLLVKINGIFNGEQKNFQFDLQNGYTGDGFSFQSTLSQKQIILNFHPTLPCQIHELKIVFPVQNFQPKTFFINGYQTWSESHEVPCDQKIKGINPWWWLVNQRYQFKRYGDYWFEEEWTKNELPTSYTFCYFKNEESEKRFFGSMGEELGYTVFQWDNDNDNLLIYKDLRGKVFSKKEEILNLIEVPQEEYLKKLGYKNKPQKPTTGWTSWYNYYDKIDEDIIHQNLEAFAKRKIPIDIFQIDDGWQRQIGDWHANEKFPNGMESLALKIHKKGYQAGLWLAPFVVSPNSFIFNHKKEWLAKKNGKPIHCGYVPAWGGKFFLLDLQKKEVLDYIDNFLKKVVDEWEFDMVKLDFLYAAAMQSDTGKSRGELVHEMMDFLHRILKHKKWLACGVQLGSTFGKADFCRIGADIGLEWEHNILANHIRYRERVSTLSSLQATLSRAFLNNTVFQNDPDVFMLRNEGNKLTKTQKETLFRVNQILGNLLFTSDNIDNYDDKMMDLYLSQFPQKVRRVLSVEQEGLIYRVHYEEEGISNNLLVNLSDKSIEVKHENRMIRLKAFESRILVGK